MCCVVIDRLDQFPASKNILPVQHPMTKGYTVVSQLTHISDPGVFFLINFSLPLINLVPHIADINTSCWTFEYRKTFRRPVQSFEMIVVQMSYSLYSAYPLVTPKKMWKAWWKIVCTNFYLVLGHTLRRIFSYLVTELKCSVILRGFSESSVKSSDKIILCEFLFVFSIVFHHLKHIH